MSGLTAVIVALTVAVAAANGSNDVSKGVATLAGAGVTRYRTAIVWGTVTTLAGALASLHLARGLTKLFSAGIVAAHPTPAFAVAVLAGTAAWVVVATVTAMPVSTTHALIGALIGAGLSVAPASVRWAAVVPRLALPLLVSVAAAYAISFSLNVVPGRVPECVCVEVAAPAEPGLIAGPGGVAVTLFSPAPASRAPSLVVGTVADCAAHRPSTRRVAVTVNGLHWASSGAAGFARGLNDTPKLVAVGAFALIPAGMTSVEVLWLVALAMAAGSVLAGIRVARRLGGDVIAMSHVEGLKANLTTAALVGLGAARGLPMSTTHVSTAAIAGTAGPRLSRLHSTTLQGFVVAWTVTPAVAGLIAAGVSSLIR